MNIKLLANSNLYLNGADTSGQIEELSIDGMKAVMVDHSPVSQHGKMQLPVGMEMVTATMTMESFYASTLNQTTNIYKVVQGQIRGNLKDFDNSGLTNNGVVVVSFGGYPTDPLPSQDYKQHENTSLAINFSLNYVKLEIDGQLIIEVDVKNNVYNTATGDILATYRSALGI